MDLQFYLVKVAKSMARTSVDVEVTDTISDHKALCDTMTQVFKNFYAITGSDWKHRWFGQEYVSLEILLSDDMLNFVVGVPKSFGEQTEKLISNFYPGSIIENISQIPFFEEGKYAIGGELKLSNDYVAPIKTYDNFQVDPMEAVLSSFSKVLPGEKMAFQMLISPVDKGEYKDIRKAVEDFKTDKGTHRFVAMMTDVREKLTKSGDDEKKDDEDDDTKYKYSQSQLAALDQKVEDELFDTTLRIVVVAPQFDRAKKLITDFASTFSQYTSVGLNALEYKEARDWKGFMQAFALRSFLSHKTLADKIAEWDYKMLMNVKELASLYHFPHSRINKSPRIRRQKYKIVPAPENIPTEWLLVGYNTFGGVKRNIYVKPKDRFRHFYVIGQTGTGKSSMFLTMAQQDLVLGNGFCMIDPHGDLCEFLLKYIPKERIDDLIYFDFSNTEYPIAFNPLEVDPDDPDEKDIVTNDLVEMFVGMYGHEIFWPRIQDYFRNACLLLMSQPEWGTMLEIVRLFTDEAFLDSKLRHLKDPVVSNWRYKTYKAMGDREKSEMIPYFQAKFGQFTTGTYVRNVIGQPKSTLRFWEMMQQRKIILCNLSKWLTWEVNSQLIGRMIGIQIKLNALKRAAIHEDERVPFFLYVDEFQNYVSQAFESILSEARKYRLGLGLAHQYIEQLKSAWLWWSIDLAKPIFGNVGNQIYLKVWPEDAEFLEKNISPEFSKSDILWLDARMGIAILSIDTQPTRPFTLQAHNPYAVPHLNSDEKVNIIKQISSLKRWTKRDIVEKEIFFRAGV